MARLNEICLYLALFLCTSISSYGQTDELIDQPLDTMLLWMQNNYYIDSNDYYQIGSTALQKALLQPDDRQMAQLHEAMASWFAYWGYFSQDSVLVHDQKALEYYIQLDDSLQIANTYRVLAIDHINNSNFDQSQEVLFKSIEIYEALNEQDGLARAHRTLGALFETMEEPASGIEYLNLAIDHYKKQEDYISWAIALHTVIRSYDALGEYENAQRAAEECIRLLEEKSPDEVFALARAYSYKSEVSRKESKLDQALRESEKAFQLAADRVGEDRAISYKQGVADILKDQGKFRQAIPIYKKIIEKTGEQDIKTFFELDLGLIASYEGIGDFENALNQYKIYSDRYREMNEEKIANLESEAVIKYETGKKDQALAAQEIELAQKNRIQLLGAGILLLLLALLGSLYYNYKKNQRINKALVEKNEQNEFLMKEIHHRVKNNLQILSSLLNLQSNYIQDSAAADAINEGRNRVESMSLIHQKLYTQDHFAAINLKEYIPDLCEYLRDTLLPTGTNIDIQSYVDVHLVDVETAIPIGLVINELITNSVKYAFADTSDGLVQVKTWINATNQLCLEVSDNGSGKSNIDNSTSTNFGSDLVRVLIKKLKGELSQSNTDGYTTLIKFDRYKLVAA